MLGNSGEGELRHCFPYPGVSLAETTGRSCPHVAECHPPVPTPSLLAQEDTGCPADALRADFFGI